MSGPKQEFRQPPEGKGAESDRRSMQMLVEMRELSSTWNQARKRKGRRWFYGPATKAQVLPNLFK